MTLNLTMNDAEELKPRITVFGVGGAGGNAVNNMIEKQLEGVEFVVANTDAQALQQSRASERVQMGIKATEGLGAGAKPAIGAKAAEESIEELVDHLMGAHMCFITAGMGGGTGTGAAPIIAQAARELGVLTVGVVTKPFQFEGAKRMRQAHEGIEALQKVVDTLIIIPNQNLFRLANEKTTFTEAFAMADDVLYQGVKGVTDLMVRPGLINLDFADVRSVMDEMGKAMMGTGEAEGEDRAVQAAEKAIANPLLDEISLKGAKGVLINITGGYDMTLFELDEAANRIREEVDPDANIIVGSTMDPEMEGVMRVSVVATGIDVMAEQREAPPAQRRPLSEPLAKAEPEPEPEPAPQVAPDVAAREQAVAAVRNRRYEEPAPRPTPAPAPAPRAEPVARVVAEEVEDELPAPAYGGPQARARDIDVDSDAASFTAPRRRDVTPSAEVQARLREAVARNDAGAPAAPAAARPAPAQPTEENAPARQRGALGSLLNRMTGHADDAPRQASYGAGAAAPSPATERYDDEGVIEEGDDRIEIPAFLRRQAN